MRIAREIRLAAGPAAADLPAPLRHTRHHTDRESRPSLADREPGHGDDIADDHGGDDWAGAEDLGDGGAACFDRGGQVLLDLAPLGVQVANVGQQLGGELAARLGGSGQRSGQPEGPEMVGAEE
jgi:hypothetical protein